MKTSILIQEGRLIDPSNGIDEILDVWIEGKHIKQVGKALKVPGAKLLNAKGRVVAPGLIDMRVHFREPGHEYKEDLYSGLRSAVRGGFTGVCPMPSTNPSIQSQADVEFILQKSRSFYLAEVIPVACVTRSQKGEELTEFGELKKGGVLAISDDAAAIQDSRTMRCALEYSKKFDLVVLAHCEDESLSAGGMMNEGLTATRLGLQGIPVECESIHVGRNLQLAILTGARLHFSHISSAKSIDVIRRAKAEGAQVTAETAPPYFTLTDEDVRCYDTNAKINPPLRSAADRDAVREALREGVIDVIASDHSPHADYEKSQEFDKAPFGMTGLETSLSLSLRLVEAGVLTLSGLVEKMSLQPARILKNGRGTLSEGAPADVTVFDTGLEWVFSKDKAESKSYNSPFINTKFKGRATDVIVDGRWVMENGLLHG